MLSSYVSAYGQKAALQALLGACALLVLAAAILPASAQSRYENRRSDRNTVGGLLGEIVRAGARSSAEKKWQALTLPMQDCMGRAISIRGYTTTRLIDQGVGPDDTRLSEMTSRCEALLSRELQRDIECDIIELGVSVSTRCNEAYGFGSGSQVRAISRDQYVLEGIRGEKVFVTQIETSEARRSRAFKEEEQQAAAEAVLQQQQVAADTLARKQAEAARQRQAVAQSELRQKLSQRDQIIASNRKQCSPRNATTGLAGLFTTSSDHQVLASLLDTNIPALKTYQEAVAWLPRAKDNGVIFSALKDRIDFDAKQWGETISRSGGGRYSWETLKSALDVFAGSCLWQQYDYLAIESAKAMSQQSMSVAVGLAPSTSTAERVGGVVLSKVPSSKLIPHIKQN